MLATKIFNLFINREKELKSLSSQISKFSHGSDVSIVRASQDAGLSSALRRVIEQSSVDFNPLYLDCRDARPEAIFDQAISAVLEHGETVSKAVLEPLVLPEKRDAFGKIISGTLAGIPFVGPVLSETNNLAFGLFVRERSGGEYTKKTYEIFQRLSKFGQPVIVADHFHCAQEHHISQLHNILYTTEDTRLIIAQNTSSLELAKQSIDKRLNAYTSGIFDFPAPDSDLAQLIISHINDMEVFPEVSYALSEKISEGLHSFLNSILNYLMSHESGSFRISETQNHILKLIYCAAMPINFSILYRTMTFNDLALFGASALEEDVRYLVQSKYLTSQTYPEGSHLLHLTRHGESLVKSEMTSSTQRLFYSNALYRTVDREIAEGDIDEQSVAITMYKLAQRIDPNRVRYWSCATVKSCIFAPSFFEAGKVLESISENLDPESHDDIDTLILASMATKHYDQALFYLERKTVKNNADDILDCFLRYRMMKLNNAYELMKHLLNSNLSPDEACANAINLIAIEIDLDLSDAREHHSAEWKSCLQKTKGFPYLLNVLAAVEPPNKAILQCNDALSIFEQRGDEFGAGSSFGNLGAHQLAAGNFAAAQESWLNAYDLLKKYGIQHVHLVANNLSCVSILTGEIDEGERWIKRCLELAQTPNIKINALTNQAALHILRGDHEAAQEGILGAIRVAELHPIARIRRRLAHNATVLFTLLGRALPNDAQGFVERNVGDERTVLIETGEDPASVLRHNFKPPVNQYWHPNPLEII